LFANLAARAINEGFHRPIGFAPTNAVNKVRENLASARRVDDLGVKLQSVDIAVGVANDGMRGIFRSAKWTKPDRHLSDLITVAIPDIQRRREFVEKCALGIPLELARAILTLGGAFYLAAEPVSDELHAVANTEHGNAEFIDGAIDLRRLRRVNAGWASRENDSGGFELRYGSGLGRVRNDFGIDLALAYAAGNHLSVLRSEIENEDFIPGRFGGHEKN